MKIVYTFVKNGKKHLRSKACFDKNCFVVGLGQCVCSMCHSVFNDNRVAGDLVGQAYLILKGAMLEAIATSSCLY